MLSVWFCVSLCCILVVPVLPDWTLWTCQLLLPSTVWMVPSSSNNSFLFAFVVVNRSVRERQPMVFYYSIKTTGYKLLFSPHKPITALGCDWLAQCNCFSGLPHVWGHISKNGDSFLLFTFMLRNKNKKTKKITNVHWTPTCTKYIKLFQKVLSECLTLSDSASQASQVSWLSNQVGFAIANDRRVSFYFVNSL